MNSIKLNTLAVSGIGIEALIQHPASITHLSMRKGTRLAAGISDGLIRLFVGIKKVDDNIADLDQAPEKVKDSYFTTIGV